MTVTSVGRQMLVGLASATLIVSLIVPSNVAASSWHNNVNVSEDSGGLGYTGLRVTRSGNVSVTINNCGPVYDTMWVWIPKSSGVWLEIGVDYKCYDNGQYEHDVFMGYGTCSTCFNWVEYTTEGADSASHNYAIRMDYGGDNAWDFYVDSDLKLPDMHFANESTSDKLQVVLETYDNTNYIASHSIHDFKKIRFAPSGWSAWSGEDSGPPNPPSPLCGFWTSSTSIQAGENTTC